MRSTSTGRPRGRYLFFFLAAISLLMFSVDSTIVAVGIPSMTRDLNTSLAWIGWTLTGFMLTMTTMMPLAGKLSENFGRFRVFVVSVGLFTLGSLLCGAAPNVYLLILFRVLQAIGGGGLMPSAVGIVAAEFPETRDRMIGLFASIVPLGGIIGPNLGGLIIEHFSWREIFLVNVPIGLVIMAFLGRRASRPEPRARRPIDMAGALLFSGVIVSLLTALTFLGNDPGFWRTPGFGGLLAGAVLCLVAFIWQERRATEPVIALDLVGRNPFLALNIYNFIFGACAFGFFSFIPYFAVVQYHFSPAESGAILTPRSLGMILTATCTSLFLIRFGYRLLMTLGMLCVFATLLLLSRGWDGLALGGLHLDAFWLLVPLMALGGVGMGLSAPTSNNAALDLMPERAAIITGIRGMFRSVGGVMGTALIVLGVELSPDKAAGMRTIFVIIAVVLLTTLLVIFRIPDTARARHIRRRARGAAARDQRSGTLRNSSRRAAKTPSTGSASAFIRP
jgi:EmrB/QacA subfamily drug resistance transporter